MFGFRKHALQLLLLSAVALAFLPGKAGAGDEVHWSPIGIGGGGNSVTWGVSPLDPNIVLAGSDVGGIFRSTDGGVTWQPRNQHLVKANRNNGYAIGDSVQAHGHFTFNPPTGNQNVVYHGVQKSSDAGNNWAINVDDSAISAGGAAVDPISPSIVYAFGYGNIYRSTDAWESSNCRGQNAGGTQCSTAPSGIACRKGMKCYQVACLPNTSSASSPGCTNYNMSMHGLVIDPNGGDRYNASLLACTDVGFFKSTDGGTTWNRSPNSSSGLPSGLPGLCTGGTKPGATCKIDSDCGGGSCVASVCGGSDAACTSDAGCPSGQTCQGGRCGGSGSQCWLTSDCATGQVCKSLSCASMTMASNASHTLYITLRTRPFFEGTTTGASGLDPWVDLDKWQGGVYKSNDFGATWTDANGLNNGLDYLGDKNPGFEQPLGTPGPNFAWVIPTPDQSFVSRVCSGEPTHSGSCSIKITYPQSLCQGGSNNGNACASDANCPSGFCALTHQINTPDPGEPSYPASSLLQIGGGTLYKLRAWYKVTNGTTLPSYAKIHWFKYDRTPLLWPGKTWHSVEAWVQDFTGSAPRSYDWQKFEVLVRAPDEAVFARIDFRAGIGTIWIDDVSFQATEDLPHFSGRGERPYFSSYSDVAVPPSDTSGNIAYVGVLRGTSADALEGTDLTGIFATLDGGNHWSMVTRRQWHDNVIDNSRYEPVCGDGVCGGRWENCNSCPGDCSRNICSGGSNNGFLCATGSECPSGSCVAPSFCCGDGSCTSAQGESRANCPVDCYDAGDHDPNRLGQNETCNALYNGAYWWAPGCNNSTTANWSIAIGLPPGGVTPDNLVIYSGNQYVKSVDGGNIWEDMASSSYTSPPGEEPGGGTYQGRGANDVFTYFMVKDSRVNRIYYGDTDNQLMVSYNNGISFSNEGWQWGGWYRAPQDLTAPLLNGDAATSILLDPSNANRIYVGVAIGNGSAISSDQSGVVRGDYTPKSGSAVGRWTWTRLGTFSGAGPGGGIDLARSGLGTLFASYYSHGVFTLSSGATESTPWTNTYTGSNWNPVPYSWKTFRIKQEPISGRFYVGAGDPTHPSGQAFHQTGGVHDETGVWESNNDGQTWCRISAHGTGLDNDMDDEPVLDLLPLGSDSLLVSTFTPIAGAADAAGNYLGNGGIYKGTRSGNCSWTWTRVLKQPKVTGLTVSPTDRSTVYAFVGQGSAGGPVYIPGQKAGIYRSDDEGVTWYAVVNDGLHNLSTGALNISDTDPNTLYASTIGTGSFVGTRSCTSPTTEAVSVPATCFDGLDNDCDGIVDYDCSIDITNQLLSSAVLVSGTVTDLKGRPDSDAAEVLKEKLVGSTKPLDVFWTFSGMPTGKVYYLNVEGFRVVGGNDTFTFKVKTKASGTCNGSEGTYTNLLALGGSSDTDAAQKISIGTVTSGLPVVCIRLQDSGVTDGTQDTISLDRVFLLPEPAEVTASSDYQTVIGSITAGSYSSTATSDDVRESLREVLDTTVTPQVSRLEHIWKFSNVPIGSSHQLNLEGTRPTGSDNPVDNFQFSYSTDGINFSDISGALINKIPEPVGGGYFTFGPSGLGGTLYIRVKDTNTTSGTSLDTVSVDRIAIKTIP